jgi:beta-lactamase regulating signal transducer with metallopeptidase domain
MQLPVFENAYFLKSLGWAITNSFWQAGLLWLLYQLITTFDRKLSSLIKYNLSISLIGTAFLWFLFTVAENFRLLSSHFEGSRISTPYGPLPGFEYINALLPYLSSIYILILCVYATRFVERLSANKALQKRGLSKAPVDYRLFATHTALHLGIKKKVQVWISAHVDVPSVTGFIKPVILMPAAILNHLSVTQVEAILLHELAHIKRDDYLINLIQSVIETILFFNPFIYLLNRLARQERENCCDDWVVSYRFDQSVYAHALLLLEEQRQLKPDFALAATNDKKNLLSRVKRLFQAVPQTSFKGSDRIKFAVFSLFLLFAILAGLPYLAEKNVVLADTHPEQQIIVDNKPVPSSYLEQAERQNFVSQPILPKKALKKSRTERLQNRQTSKPKVEEQYIKAFINEELLEENDPEPAIPTLAAEKDVDDIQYIIKVEEQQSGKKQTNTYLFELKNEDGQPSIKPLIILNKLKINITKPNIPASVTDSLVTIPKTRSTS